MLISTYTRHNEAFHNAIIGLADNPTVSDAYHRLGVAGLMVSLLKQGAEAGQEVIDDHCAIVEAFERRSLDDAMRVIARHNENAKKTIDGPLSPLAASSERCLQLPQQLRCRLWRDHDRRPARGTAGPLGRRSRFRRQGRLHRTGAEIGQEPDYVAAVTALA